MHVSYFNPTLGLIVIESRDNPAEVYVFDNAQTDDYIRHELDFSLVEGVVTAFPDTHEFYLRYRRTEMFSVEVTRATGQRIEQAVQFACNFFRTTL